MKAIERIFTLMVVLLSLIFTPQLHAQSSVFTYQGQLVDGGFYANGFYDLEFTLYTDAVSGSALGVLTNTATEVTDGLFTVSLDFGSGVFDGSDLWLEIGAVTNGGGVFTILTPRQPITSTPYAIKAANAMTVTMGTVSDPSFIGTTTTAPLDLTVNNQRGLRLEYATDGLSESVNVVGGYHGNYVSNGVVGATIAGGGMLIPGFNYTNKVTANFGVVSGGTGNTAAGERSAVSGGSGNTAGGFASAVGGGVANAANGSSSAIGGGNNNKVDGYSSTISGGYSSEILAGADYGAIGGGRDNVIAANSGYATIAGGQKNDIGVNSEYSAIGGGTNNTASGTASTISGGRNNTASGWDATVSGGQNNTAGSFFATAGGGAGNTANGIGSTVAGGSQNLADGIGAVIGGGEFNTAPGDYAVVPGGKNNEADNNYAFAAGYRAKANHQGAFVWADSQNADFSSSSSNQFLIRASGGVGIGTASPGGPLHIKTPTGVDSSIRLTSGGSWTLLMNQSPSSVFFISNGGQQRLTIEPGGDIGIGTANPTEKLHVVGNIYATGTITPSSDRNLKKNFNPVNALEVLERVSSLPIQQWTYKAEADAVRHVGPMAQDFHAAFGYGANDVTIATVDADGVALAAIQGLNQKLEFRSQRSEDRSQLLEEKLVQKETEITELKARLTALEIIIANLHTEGN